MTDNPSVRIYVNKIVNRITFKFKTIYYLVLLALKTLKLLEKMTEVVLSHCNVVNNNYQRNSRVVYKFIPNKLFVQLLDISL